MNEEMQLAWLEISQMLGEPTREELDVFLRTWQRASQATREALAEQPAQQEPVAHPPCKGMNCGITRTDQEHSIECQAEHAAAIAGGQFVKPEQEPVAWICEGSSSDEKHAIDYWPGDVDDLPIGTQLYTSPSAQRKPLTDEKIFEISNGFVLCMFPVETRTTDRELAFARAIEKAVTRQPQIRPLTDDVMWKLWNSQGDDAMEQTAAITFARAIEAAHGIKENT